MKTGSYILIIQYNIKTPLIFINIYSLISDALHFFFKIYFQRGTCLMPKLKTAQHAILLREKSITKPCHFLDRNMFYDLALL